MAKPIPIITTPSLVRRFWAAVDRRGSDECWEWTLHRNVQGYGRIGLSSPGPRYMSHRVAWTVANGPIPEGLYVCHKCDNPPCCNPAHLFVGTLVDNMQDMIAKGRDNSPVAELRERTHCARAGHPLAGDNLLITAKGFRSCRQCARDRERERAKAAGVRPYSERTHCPAGHEYAGDNLKVDQNGWRHCLACRRKRDLDRYYRRKAEAAEAGVPFRRVVKQT